MYHVSTLNRADGRSTVQYSSYLSRSKLYDEKSKIYYDNSKKNDLVYSEIILPNFAPKEFSNRETLWNAVEHIEKNKNSTLARSIIFALPKELDTSTHISMTKKYIIEFFVSKGMCADFAIHDKNDGNPHVHLLLTTRSLNTNGEWMCKQQKNYELDCNGAKIYDKETKTYKCSKSTKINNWDDRNNVEIWRKGWADECNYRFKQLSIDKEITHMSYERQGLDIEPTIHLGYNTIKLEERGFVTDRGEKYQMILNNRKSKERELELCRSYEHTR